MCPFNSLPPNQIAIFLIKVLYFFNQIGIIIIYFNNLHLLLLFDVINFDDIRKYFSEVDMIEWLCVLLTDEVCIQKSRIDVFYPAIGLFFLIINGLK
jgi:hypothetical protein